MKRSKEQLERRIKDWEGILSGEIVEDDDLKLIAPRILESLRKELEAASGEEE